MSTPKMRADASEVYRRYLSAVVMHGQAGARTVGLGATDLYALNILELSGPLTPGELGTRSGLTTGPTTRLIDRLEAAGYVRRAPVPGDRRKVTVELVGTPEDLNTVLAPVRRAVGEILGSYTAEQLAVLFDYFERATDAYYQATEELRAP
ncbi:MarR family transcriptional regulator [Nocardia sp. NPDC050712]|uniref:MarR family winged helix-turn-helix transcriptional regulator n=1 Tax=Nocardia sp. NPDC050712 TaxID=3155518 RepID=UPI0033EB6123